MTDRPKIVMISMFRNESQVMRRMLESCAPHIDYWVLQDNGSTDGTDQIVRDFFLEHPIPGYLYRVEEGWKGFGWNRDHLIQTCQARDHGCDWILKMDCDECLEVDPTFDWDLLRDKTVHAWNVPAVGGTCIYYRTWLWNADLPWRFNHDPCHETIYSALPDIGTDYRTRDLPPTIRHRGFNEGQSWSVPTKFVTDALVLEEKMIRENNMLEDMYHFFYIGKSYNDCYQGDFFPLKQAHNREFARRAIWYLQQYVNYAVGSEPRRINEMCYMAMIMSAECYTYLGDIEAAVAVYRDAEDFAPGRNDHLMGLAKIFQRHRRWDDMLAVTQIMMRPERVNPFPNYSMFIDTAMYHDYGDQVQTLHQIAQQHVDAGIEHRFDHVSRVSATGSDTQPSRPPSQPLLINAQPSQRMWIVDDFYSEPDLVREYAMSLEFRADIQWYKGLRTSTVYRPLELQHAFERIMNRKIQNWDVPGFNGCFQITTADDPQVYHYDTQTWAAMIYLTPNAPLESGTRLHRSRTTGVRHRTDVDADSAFQGGFYDSTRFDTIDSAGNVYNRLVIMDAQNIHSAGTYFGNSAETGRLVHLFFFD